MINYIVPIMVFHIVIYTEDHKTLLEYGDGFYLGRDGLSIGSKVYINKDGYVRLGNRAVQGDGRFWRINQANRSYDEYQDSYIAYNTERLNHDSNSVYLGTDGISLSKDKFYVTNDGNLNAKSGEIAGWTFNNIKFYSTSNDNYSIEISSTGSIKQINSDNTSNWEINRSGNATFKNITATGTINALSGYLGLPSKNPITNTGLKFNQGSIEFGAATPDKDNSGLRCDSNGNVRISGDIYARNGYFSGEVQSSSGKIGGWDISADGFVNNNSAAL